MGDGKPTDAEIAAANDLLLKRILGILEAPIDGAGPYRDSSVVAVAFAALREREELMKNLANVQARCTKQEEELRALRRAQPKPQLLEAPIVVRETAREVLFLLHAILSKTGPVEVDAHAIARGFGSGEVESKSDDLKGTRIYFARDAKGNAIRPKQVESCKNHCIDFVCAACASRLMEKELPR